jgi:hypothetical protein
VAAFDQMTASRKTVLDAVQEVRETGFSVGPDYTVTYTGKVANDAEYAKRLEEAKQHRNYIRHRVAAMVAHDRENAQKMDEALSELETFTFDEPKAGPDDKIVGDDDRKQVHPSTEPGSETPHRHQSLVGQLTTYVRRLRTFLKAVALITLRSAARKIYASSGTGRQPMHRHLPQASRTEEETE